MVLKAHISNADVKCISRFLYVIKKCTYIIFIKQCVPYNVPAF